MTSATLKTFRYASLKELNYGVPDSRLGTLEVSRVIMGGNLIGGWAHARDLLYVSKLKKTHHSDRKVFETPHLAEQCGINTFLTNPSSPASSTPTGATRAGKIQFISDGGYKNDLLEGIPLSVDVGRPRLLRPRGHRRRAREGRQDRRSARRSTSSAKRRPRRDRRQLARHRAGVRRGRTCAGFPGEDAPPLRLLVGPQGRPERQHLAREPRGDGRVHERPPSALSPTRSSPRAPSPRPRASGSRSKTAGTSSASACTTSRSWRT